METVAELLAVVDIVCLDLLVVLALVHYSLKFFKIKLTCLRDIYEINFTLLDCKELVKSLLA